MALRQVVPVTFQSAAVATGNGTAADSRGCAAFGVQIVGITTATITFEATLDGTNWVAVVAKNMNSGAEATTATADGLYQVACFGTTQLRCRISAWTSGTIYVYGNGIDIATSMPQTSVAAVIGAVDTELPAAAALADAASNPTTPKVGSCLLGYNGATWDLVKLANTQKDLSTVTITTIQTCWTPTSGKKVCLMGGSISVSAAVSVLFEDNSAGTTVYRTPKLLADTPYSFVVNGGQGYTLAAANNVLKITSSAAATVIGTLWGVEVG